MICYLCSREAVHFGEKNGHTLYRCTSCRFVFVSSIPSSTDSIYGREYFEGAEHGFGYVDYDEDKEPMVPAFKKYLSLIRAALGSQGKLLDVGAATGFFITLAKQAGFSARGVELSDHAASLGRVRGLDIQTGTLADVSGSYDCIAMLDVIEHVPDPRNDLMRAHVLLRNDGLLAINTPNAGSVVARVMGVRWHAIIPPEHLYYFDRENLAHLLREVGFEVVLSTTVGKSFTVKYIMKTLYKSTSFRVFDLLASFFSYKLFSRFSLPINLHDNMFILARKI